MRRVPSQANADLTRSSSSSRKNAQSHKRCETLRAHADVASAFCEYRTKCQHSSAPREETVKTTVRPEVRRDALCRALVPRALSVCREEVRPMQAVLANL